MHLLPGDPNGQAEHRLHLTASSIRSCRALS